MTITDSAASTKTCQLYYVSPQQINLVVPDGVTNGAATLTVQRDSGKPIAGNVTVNSVAPGLFTLGGSGVGAIGGLRVDADGRHSDVPVYTYNDQQKQYVAAAIDLGAATDQVYLSIYGTGIRGFGNLSAISVTIAGKPVPVLAAVAQSEYPGLDQVNVGPLPRTLAGSGSTNLSLRINNVNSNNVTVNIK